MLVLSRKKGESIVINVGGKLIEIMVLDGTGVRIGIDAPIEFQILRKELIAKGTNTAA